jgi:predicted HTH transcriptional regulator
MVQALTHPSLFFPKRNNPNTKYCQHRLCNERTREGKEYCSEHINNLPYVSKLLGKIDDKAAEEVAVEKRGYKAVAPDSETLKELLIHLKFNGARTVRRLMRELQLNEMTVAGYIEYLVRHNQAKTSFTSRGDKAVSLIEDL